jgi:photosystem II stability/assembly factor-like uncharacterized protein
MREKSFASIKFVLILMIVVNVVSSHLHSSECPNDWYSVNQPQILWWGVCGEWSYNNFNGFVAVGNMGTIRTSQDGINWIQRSSGTTQSLRGICRGMDTFYAVGYGGIMLRSSTGETWTRVPTGTTQNLRSVAVDELCELSVVAVGDNGTIVTNKCYGDVFMPVNSGVTNRLYGVCMNWDVGFYVAVGVGGVILKGDFCGETWQVKASPTIQTLWSVTYCYLNDDIVFVAVGNNGTIITGNVFGENWTKRNSGVTCNLHSVTYTGNQCGGMFLAFGWNGPNGHPVVLKSIDGINWTNTVLTRINDQRFSVAYGNNRFVAVGDEMSIYSICE